MFFGHDRRLEAETYLASGYGIRLSLEERKVGLKRIADLADVRQPPRLTGTVVSREFGMPYLAATQIFDMRPAARRYLAIDKIPDASALAVSRGMILVTRSRTVGRATLAHAGHENVIISDDLLRVEPRREPHWGWLYAYLRSPQGRAMMAVAKYGHMIKHLDPGHLNSLPIPLLRDDLLALFGVRVRAITELRCRAHDLAAQAEAVYAGHFPDIGPDTVAAPSRGFGIGAAEMFERRRRLDAGRFNPAAGRISDAFAARARSVEPLWALIDGISVPGRFKHVYGDGGTPYLDSADILEVSPDVTKHVLSMSMAEQEEYHVEPGWLLVPCSGQVHGNIGHMAMATEWHVGKMVSNHVMRIRPKESGPPAGYLQCALGHPVLGRPLVIRFAFGSSVPELAPEDIASIPVPRLGREVEEEIAAMITESARARAEADEEEDAIIADAEGILDRFAAGDRTETVATGAGD